MSRYFTGNFNARAVFEADKNGTPIQVCEARTKRIAAKIVNALNRPKQTAQERQAIAEYDDYKAWLDAAFPLKASAWVGAVKRNYHE